jgi:hypothetical protein
MEDITDTTMDAWEVVKQHLPGVDTKITFYVQPVQLFGEINSEDGGTMHGVKCIAYAGTIFMEGETSRPAKDGEECVVWLKTGLHPILALAGCELKVVPHTKRATRKGMQFRPYDIYKRPDAEPRMVEIRSLNELDHERLPSGFVDEALAKRQLMPHDLSLAMTETVVVEDD